MTFCTSDHLVYTRVAASFNLRPYYSTVKINEGMGWRPNANLWACETSIKVSECRSRHGTGEDQTVTKCIGRKKNRCGESGRRTARFGGLLVNGNFPFALVLSRQFLDACMPYQSHMLSVV